MKSCNNVIDGKCFNKSHIMTIETEPQKITYKKKQKVFLYNFS